MSGTTYFNHPIGLSCLKPAASGTAYRVIPGSMSRKDDLQPARCLIVVLFALVQILEGFMYNLRVV